MFNIFQSQEKRINKKFEKLKKRNSFYDRNELAVNIDITNKCALACLRCGRQFGYKDNGLKVPGREITLEEFDLISDHFSQIGFCGQYSDPTHHSRFIEFLNICKEKDVYAQIHVASSARSEKWFIEAFKANPDATWIFGIDGKPEESHLYRVNQDGPKLFQIMLDSKKYLNNKPRWQYIIFKYNQDYIEEAKDIAKKEGLLFFLIQSNRWIDDDPLKPTIGQF